MIFNLSIDLNALIGICSAILIVVVSSIMVTCCLVNKKKNNKVMNASSYIKELKQLNEKYSFQVLSKVNEEETFDLNSKRAYDNFDFYKRTKLFIKENFTYYQDLLEKIDFNISFLAKYKKELSKIKITTDESIAKENKMSLKSFRKREAKLGTKLIKHPTTFYQLTIEWEYTSPAGRNHYSNSRVVSLGEIRKIVKGILLENEKVQNTRSKSCSNYRYPRENSGKIYTNDDIEDIED